MKLKINKASDLSSISVLPPQSRRSHVVSTGLESSSVFGRSQTVSLLRPQQSQLSHPSLSQGVSSQHGIFSQLSQNSQDEPLIYEKNGSQERDNSVRRASCLPRVSYSRDESQIMGSKTSNNLMRKWPGQEYKCQISEELEHRFVMIETSLSRLGMILDSVQNDILQVNKGTKEVALEMEGLRQKLLDNDDKVQATIKGQEDLKTRVDRGMASLLDQLNLNISEGNSGDLMSMLSALSEKIDAEMVKLRCDLSNDFGKEVQAIACSMKITDQLKGESSTEYHKAARSLVPPKEFQHLENSITIQPKGIQKHLSPNVETRGWISVKLDRMASRVGIDDRGRNQESSFAIDSDEDIDGGFSCLLEDTETYVCSMEDVKEETARILKKARSRKRKHYSNNAIVID